MYLGKNTTITKVIKDTINTHCLETYQDRHDVATALGIVKGTLDNKLKPSMPESTFTIEEILELSDITENNAILKAMCAERSLIVFDPIDVMPDGGDVVSELKTHIMQLSVCMGEHAQCVIDAIDDDKIDSKEKNVLIGSIRTLREELRKMEKMLEDHDPFDDEDKIAS